MRLRLFFPVLVLILLGDLAASGGCAKQPPATASRTPRIVSTDPSATQILLQIGAGKTLVGVSPWDKPLLPASLRDLPVVGGYLNLDEELVMRLHPTALILQQSPQRITSGIRGMARQSGIHIINIRLDTFSRLYATSRILGQISGHQKQATAEIKSLQRQLSILKRGNHKNAPRVVYMISTEPIMVVGADNFIDRELTLAGGVNVAERCGNGFPTITRETLVDLNPQVLLIIEPGQPPASSLDDPRITPWLKLPIAAATTKRVDLITWPRAQMLTLQVGRNIERLRKLIQFAARGVTP